MPGHGYHFGPDIDRDTFYVADERLGEWDGSLRRSTGMREDVELRRTGHAATVPPRRKLHMERHRRYAKASTGGHEHTRLRSP